MAQETNSNPAPAKEYLVFDLAITRQSENSYRAHVRNSPAGNGANIFEYKLDTSVIDSMRVRVAPGANGKPTVTAPTDQQRKAFGGELFKTVFSGEVYARFETSLAIVKLQDKDLRLRLNLSETPELAQLPWEILFDLKNNRFFSLSSDTPLVRFFELAEGAPPLRIIPPLRILVLISPPTDAEKQAAEREWENLSNALEDLQQKGILQLEHIERASLAQLQSALRKRDYHILHFIGASAFDEQTGQGSLLLHDSEGQSRAVADDKLGILLHDHESLRLVILSSNDGARANRDILYSGIAPTLIQQGIPAVIAMQSDITSTASKAFALGFYQSLYDKYPIDAALIEGRKAILFGDSEAEWSSPVLFMRSPDGVLFNIDSAPAPVAVPSPPATTTPPARESLTFNQLLRQATTAQKSADRIWEDEPKQEPRWRKKYEEAYGYLERADKVTPDNPDVLLRMAQVQARLDPEYSTTAKTILYRLEDLIDEPMDDNQVRILGEAFYLHATLSEPPSEKLLQRARPLFQQLNDEQKMEQIDAQLKRVAGPVVIQKAAAVTPPPAATQEFNPSGRWNIQVQDMVGSRLFVDFKANGSFLMQQQVGMYQVPVSGNWNFNPLTRQLALQGVVNTFQPFILALTLGSAIPNGFIATGSDGIGYILTRAES